MSDAIGRLREENDAGFLHARVVVLEAIMAGHVDPPTTGEVKAHLSGWWRYETSETWGEVLLGDPHDLSAFLAEHPGIERWFALDANGRPCAWPGEDAWVMTNDAEDVERLRTQVARVIEVCRKVHESRWPCMECGDDGAYKCIEAIKDAGLDKHERRLRDEHARLVRAISDRKGALESVPPARVQAYLAAHGWTMHSAAAIGGFPVEFWRIGADCGVTLLTTTEPADYANCMGRVARACGSVEGRDITFVIADWLTEESGR